MLRSLTPAKKAQNLRLWPVSLGPFRDTSQRANLISQASFAFELLVTVSFQSYLPLLMAAFAAVLSTDASIAFMSLAALV